MTEGYVCQKMIFYDKGGEGPVHSLNWWHNFSYVIGYISHKTYSITDPFGHSSRNLNSHLLTRTRGNIFTDFSLFWLADLVLWLYRNLLTCLNILGHCVLLAYPGTFGFVAVMMRSFYWNLQTILMRNLMALIIMALLGVASVTFIFVSNFSQVHQRGAGNIQSVGSVDIVPQH